MPGKKAEAGPNGPGSLSFDNTVLTCGQSLLLIKKISRRPSVTLHTRFLLAQLHTLVVKGTVIISKMREPESSYVSLMALGLVCDGSMGGCRPTSHQLGTSYFITTPVDKAQALHMYDINLHLLRVSTPIPSSWLESSLHTSFSHLSAYQHFTFVAINKIIGVFHVLRPSTAWREHDDDITAMFVIGNLLITVDEGRTLLVWELPESVKDSPPENGVVISRIVLPPDFSVSCIAHPQTYVNKVLLGGHDGRCILLNIRSKAVVHIFQAFPSSVTVLTPSPVVDVVAVGTADGNIYLHNFRLNKTIFNIRTRTALNEPQNNTVSDTAYNNSVRAISFRSDGIETMVTADAMGSLYIWDLNERRLSSEVHSVHPNGVAFAEFLPSEPLMVTTGSMDNAIKVHVFDDDEAPIRLLRSREGHYLPPTVVKFHGHDGFTMISAGLDRELRSVCAVQDAKNRQFSQRIADKRSRFRKRSERRRSHIEIGDRGRDMKHLLPPVTGIACKTVREKDSEFGSIVTMHEGMKEAYTWKIENGASHKHVLSPPVYRSRLELSFKREAPKPSKRMKSDRNGHASKGLCVTCVVMTPCGNYAFIGFTDGRIHCFNLQSGLHQAAFEDSTLEPEDTNYKDWGRAHDSAVKSLCVDGCGDTLASVAWNDSKVRFWKVHSRTIEGDDLITPQSVSKLAWCETSDLLAMTGDDFSVLVYDVPTRTLARVFKGHCGPIVDLCYDKRGRNIVTASIDGTIRTWDVLSGCVVDILKCSDSPTSISLCPEGEFLASTHINCLSIRLWVKSDGYGHKRPDMISESEVSSEEKADDEDNHSLKSAMSDVEPRRSEDRCLSNDIVTLSSRPSKSWTVLSRIRELSERNKAPDELIGKDQNAPFFLPTVKGLAFKFDMSDANASNLKNEKQEREAQEKRFLKESVGEFVTLIENRRFSEARELLNKADAPRADLELRNIDGQHALRMAVEYFLIALGTTSCFELTQAHLQSFLTLHGSRLASNGDLAASLDDLIGKQEQAWHRLRKALNSVDSLSSHFLGQV